MESRSISKDRQIILKGVYEDNLRTVSKASGAPAEEPTPSFRRRRALSGVRLVLWALGLFVALGGILYRSLDAKQQSDIAAAAPSFVVDAPGSTLVAGVPQPWAPPAAAGPAGVGLPVAQLYGLQFRTIVIDPGHGGRDPGTIGQRGLMEKEITLDVARRLKARLERYPGYRILLTRDGDTRLTLRDRIEFANEHKADLFISVHVNWLPVDSVAPIETYYYGPGSDDKTIRLAERENRHSGYSLAEFNELTRQLGLELKAQESKDVAVSIQKGLYRNMRRINANVSDWGVKAGDFMVLLGVNAPSVLAEIASISNPAEEAKLNTPEHREKLAMFMEEGIVNYLRQHANENGTTEHATEEEE